MNKKYEFTGETKKLGNLTLHRIRALIDFDNVKAGDLGGWIEKEANLNQCGHAWVFGNAKVAGHAWVFGNAKVYGNAEVSGNAEVFANAKVYGNAKVAGHAWVFGNAKVYGNAEVFDNAGVFGNASVFGDASVFDDVSVFGDAEVSDNSDILWISKIGSRNDTVTFIKSKDSILVKVGCFKGTLDEFENKVIETHGNNKHAQAYNLAIQLAKLRITGKENDCD